MISKKMLRSSGITDTDKMLGLLRDWLSITLNGPTQLSEFLHLSLQEFLAAIHASTQTRKVYEKNPLSSVLTSYAGLTHLTTDRVFQMLNEILLRTKTQPNKDWKCSQT